MTTLAADTSTRQQLTALAQADTVVRSSPFSFLVAKDILPGNLRPSLQADFPALKGAGYLPYDASQCGEAINALIEEIVAPDFADAIGERLGIETLSQYPTFISISRTLHKRHGRIHTDGKSKIATALLYLNNDWETDGRGCLRLLNRGDDFEDTAVPEIPPAYGTLVAFKRADNSFHGHLPFEGERRVIQVAWLVSAEDKARKAKRGRLAHKLKRLQQWLRERFGGQQGDTASR